MTDLTEFGKGFTILAGQYKFLNSTTYKEDFLYAYFKVNSRSRR